LQHAKKGNAAYAKMIVDRVDGVLTQEVEVSGLENFGSRLTTALEKRKDYE
jgi:hypothetical protein